MRRLVYILFPLIFLAYHLPVFAGNPPDPGKSTITGTSAPADGLTSSSVTVVLRDAGGNTLSGKDSVMITSSNTSTSFNPSSVTLDGSGIFYTQMKSSFVGSVPVTVTDTSTNNAQITGYIAFYKPGTTPPTPGACTNPPPGSAVQLTSAESSGDHTITLTWVGASNPVTYYLLSYGLSSGNYIYGVPNVGGQGTTSFTVGGLTTGKKYYFVVRAGNGCTPGNFSNELSAVVGITPTPSPVFAPADAAAESNPLPTDSPQTITGIPTPISTEVITPVPPPGASSPVIGYIMIGATALGVVCAVIGAFLLHRINRG